MSGGGGEFDVDWAPVDDEDCDNLFAPDDDDDDAKDIDNAVMVSEDDAEEATHPETAGQSSEEEEPSIHSSVDEGERKEAEEDGAFPTSSKNSWENETNSRPSWVTNDSSIDDENQSIPRDSRPPPYEPPPNDIAKTEVNTLSPGTSRLATFSGDLKLRFSDNSNTSQGSGDDDHDGPEVKQSEEDDDDGFPQEQPWPGDDDGPNNGGGDDDEDANREAEGGDAFSAEVIKPIERTQPTTSKLGKELSTNWMNFDDDKWGSSMHSKQQSEHSKPSVGQPMKFDEEKWDSPPPKALEEQTSTSILSRATSSGTRSSKTTTFADDVTEPEEVPNASKYKKKKNGKQGGFSLEAGLAIVSKKTGTPSMAPEAEQNGGAEANEVVSFWQEGEAEEEAEEDDNDPLSMALKAKQAEQPHDSRSEERKLYDSNTFKNSNLSSYSQLSAPSPHSNNQDTQQQPVGPGWLQKGLGSAMNLVANIPSNLPFTKPKDTDEPIKDDNVEEAEEAEEDDMPFPNYTNLNMGAAGATTTRTESTESMADVSAMSSEDSALANRMGAGEKMGMSKSDREDAIIRATAAAMQQADNNYDPLKAAVEKMNDQSTVDENARGITFSKETKMARLAVKINPIFDLFIDLPHPTAETESPNGGAIFIGAPTDVDEEVKIQDRIRDSMQDISCLTFPDYDSSILQEEEEEGATPLFGETIMDIPGFQHYTFTLKLESGTLIYAHVRRYLPPLTSVPFRYCVGRRLGRAMVMFTRFPGGDDFFATALKTLDAIGSQHNSMKSASISRPQKWFLQNLYQKHYRVCQNYATNLEDRRGGPHILTIQGLEFPDCMEHYAHVDSTHFFMPKSLLHAPVIPQMKTSFTCSVLPVLRCLGVVNSLRLFSAMLSERRIILVSVSATRLDRSVRAALTMLTHGMLNWSHISISVLPPDLWSVLKSPSPYIVGILAPLAYRLELTDRLGDVVVFNLDENTVVSMGDQKLNKLVPDLCRSLSEEMLKKRRIALPENVATEKDMTALAILNSTADFLAQDLVEIFKADKKTMFGTSVKAKHVAKKATKVVKSTFNYFFGGGAQEEEGDQEVVEVKKTKQEKRMEPDAIYIEGCRNEAGEEAARLAFVSFFLRMLGNRDGYSYQSEDSDYNFDKEKFLLERESRGDGGGSPMWTVLVNFCETQMAQDWVRMREEHIRARQPMPIDAPLFWQCVDFLENKDIDFGILNVRSVSRMMLQKTSVQQMLPSNVRRLVMALTSKKKFEGNSDEAISDIAELARESGSALYDVMSVVWLRTRDSKGLQWVHGYQSMKVLREILLHGPLAAVADATDGIQRVRTLAFRRSQGCEHIQEVAMEIYNLLTDRSRLFLRRRVAAEHRRNDRDSVESPLTRDTRLNLKTSFREIHSAMNPALRPAQVPRRRASLSSRRASLSTRLPHRLSITKHIMALEPLDDEASMDGFNNIMPTQDRVSRQRDFAKDLVHDTLNNRPEASQSGSLGGDLATARRYVREIGRKTKEDEKERVREQVRRRDTNAMGVELLKKQFMLLKVAIYISPIFYFFGNHEHFLAIVMFLWLSQQLQVFRAPIDTGSY